MFSSWIHKNKFTTFFFLNLFIYFYFWLCWVFVSARGLSLVAASGGHSSSRCAGLSPSRPLWLRSMCSRSAGSVVVAHGPSWSVACGIFPAQGSNPCPLHWQAESQPLRHQGSPCYYFLIFASPWRATLIYSILVFPSKFLSQENIVHNTSCLLFLHLFLIWIHPLPP